MDKSKKIRLEFTPNEFSEFATSLMNIRLWCTSIYESEDFQDIKKLLDNKKFNPIPNIHDNLMNINKLVNEHVIYPE